MWQRRRRTYRERGAIRFNLEERQSYALLVDIRVVSVVAIPYTNLTSNPPESFYGKVTTFEGSVPTEITVLKFANQRVLSLRNENAARSLDAQVARLNADVFGNNLGEAITNFNNSAFDGLYSPVLEHREEILKIVMNPLSQFEVTIWRLAFGDTPTVAPDFSDPDPTRGDDQYPEPTTNPVDNPYAGNPAPSAIPGNLDPRDFAEQEPPVEPGVGTLLYESENNNTGNFTPRVVEGIRRPGSIQTRSDGAFSDQIVWVDDQGTETNMIRTNFGPAQVRLVRVETDDGQTFIPDPASLTT